MLSAPIFNLDGCLRVLIYIYYFVHKFAENFVNLLLQMSMMCYVQCGSLEKWSYFPKHSLAPVQWFYTQL